MATNIVGYTNDRLDDIVTYTGGETDTAIVNVDNVDYKIYATVKDGSLTKLVAADTSMKVEQTADNKQIKLNISTTGGNRLELRQSGVYVGGPSEADIDNIRHEILGLQEDIVQDGRHINELERKIETVKSTIPSKTSQLINDSGFIKSNELQNYATKTYVDTKVSQLEYLEVKFVRSVAEVVKPNILYLVRRGGEESDVYDEYIFTTEHKAERIGGLNKAEITALINEALATKQDKLIAGNNITIRGNVISADLSGIDDYRLLRNKPKINNVELCDNKSSADLGLQGRLISGQNIKTINGQSILGSGNIEIQGGGSGTVQSVNHILPDANGNINIPIPSIEGLAKQEDVDAQVAVLQENINRVEELIPDVSNFASKDELQEVEAKIPSIDNLATKEEVEEVKNLIPDVSDLATKAELNLKQNKLTAGNNITINGNIISAKDTTYTAGSGISIVNNVISAIPAECKLGETFITNVTVGNLKAGTELTADMTIAQVLKLMLMKPVEVITHTYAGGSDTIPTSMDQLVEADVETSILTSGTYERNISAGNPDTEMDQYVCLAIPSNLVVNEWVAKGAESFKLPFSKTELGEYNVWYLNTPSYDEDLGGTNYIINITEA